MVFGFRKGGKIDISLQVDRPEGPFYPGDAVRADVALEVEGGTPVREVRAGLVLWERYQWVDRDSDGDLDRHWAIGEAWVCKEVLVPEGAIPDGFGQTYGFDWSIRAALSRRLRKAFTVEQEVFVYNGPGRA
jgi:hypothetical protein